jgi:hypothetical protein
MRFGAAQRTIGICNRLKARYPECLKLRLDFRPPDLAMF